MLRDWIVDVKLFRLGTAMQRFGVDLATLMASLNPLVERGTVGKHMDKEGGLFFAYQPPSRRPVNRPSHMPPELAARLMFKDQSPLGDRRGEAVPYTGRGKGPSGKPGLDKRRKDKGAIRKGQRGVK